MTTLKTLQTLLAACALTGASAAPATQDDTVRLASEAYIFGYPLVLMSITEDVSRARAGLNQFIHLREFPDYTFRAVVRPNADTLYSGAWLDVGGEPVILSVPDTKGRYYLIQLMDAWSNTFAVTGSRTTGTKAGNFAIVGQHWSGHLPPGVTALHSPTSTVWMIGRIQTNTASDYAFVHSLQDQILLTPWGDWGKPRKPNPPEAKYRPTGRTPLREIEQMDTTAFFSRLSALMHRNPPAPADAPLVRRLARLGIEPGKEFDPKRLPDDIRRALESGVREARKSLAQAMPTSKHANGWDLNYDWGKYGVNYFLRASVARVALGANLPEDAVYPMVFTDSAGRPLEGTRRYILHFQKDQLPPVNAFWSLTVYDARGFFTENSIGRYAIGDRDHLHFNADGSLDIYLQHARPGPDKESNWLPVPSEPFNIAMRLYWPKPIVLNGTWAPPPVRRVE